MAGDELVGILSISGGESKKNSSTEDIFIKGMFFF